MPKAANFGFELWLDDMARVLPGYPEVDVRLAFLDPVEGLRKTHTFLPDLPAVTKFLDDRRRRRGRILANAQKVIDRHKPEDGPVMSEEERKVMARHIENVVRRYKGLPAIELVEARRAAQAEFNDYATFRGNGDLMTGLQMLIDEGCSEPPAGWRERSTGWQGEVA
jgi:hypothetical protein